MNTRLMQHIPAQGLHVAVSGQGSISISECAAIKFKGPLSWRHAALTDHVHRHINGLIVLLHLLHAVPEACSFRYIEA